MPAATDQRVIAAFIDYLKVEKGLAALSVAAYTRDLKQFQTFLKSKRRTLLDCRRDDVRSFVRKCVRDAAADAARASGDQRHPVLEVLH